MANDKLDRLKTAEMERGRGVTEYSTELGFENEDDFLAWLSSFKNVGDIGSGEGELSKEVAEFHPEFETKFVNIDYDPRGGVGEQITINSDGSIPLENESLDAAVACHSLGAYGDSSKDIEANFKEANRILKPGAELIVNVYPLVNEEDIPDDQSMQVFAESREQSENAKSFWVHTPERVERVVGIPMIEIAERCGFKVISKKGVSAGEGKATYYLALRLQKI